MGRTSGLCIPGQSQQHIIPSEPKQQKFIVSHPGGWKCKVEVSAGLASPVASLLRCGWLCSLYPHMVFLCVLDVFPL